MHADAAGASRANAIAGARAHDLQRPVLASTTRLVRAPDPISAFTQAALVQDRALWMRPSTGEALVGIGSAASLVGAGARRFEQIAEQWRDLVADAVIDGSANAGPLLMGGFSFDPSSWRSSPWKHFPDARFVLPETLITIRGGAAWNTTNVIAGATHNQDARIEAISETRTGLSPREWQALVGDIARGIRDETLGVRKVVLARAEDIRPTRTLEDALRRLAAEYPSCTIFALARGDTCFLGATPERLISLQDGVATTMALAGSGPRNADPVEDARLAQRLASDPKELTEHALVVGALQEALAPMCTRVVVDAEPRVRKLSNVQHLLTSLRGQVAPGRSVLDLVERLHPTPAVGGFPRERALELIRERERLDRGWYAGALGWADVRGEGDFVVGLRSALWHGESATLYAGCGVVGGSNPATEYAEWGWKLVPMRSALQGKV